MVHGHTVPRSERDVVADVDDFADGLVAERHRGLPHHVPIHNLAGAQAARLDADQHVASSERGYRDLLETQIAGSVVDRRDGRGRSRYAHVEPSGRTAYLAPTPRSRS